MQKVEKFAPEINKVYFIKGFTLIHILSGKGSIQVDFIVAIVFIIAPFLLPFEGIDAYYYWINGMALLTVVSLHKPEVTV